MSRRSAWIIAGSVCLGIATCAVQRAEAHGGPWQQAPLQKTVVQKGPIALGPVQHGPLQKLPIQKMGPVQKLPLQMGPLQKGPLQKVAYQPCCPHKIRYVQHHPCKRTCCGCSSTVQTVLDVTDPRCCCTIQVPVCLPGCCTSHPQVSARNGLLVRSVSNFTWCCGYRVRVVINHHGDVVVHYYGT